MQQRAFVFVIVVLIASLGVIGCAQSAGEEKDPTPSGNQLVQNQVDPTNTLPSGPTQEIGTQVAQDNMTPTETATTAASSVPATNTATVDVSAGQGGFTSDLVTFTPTNTQAVVTEVSQGNGFDTVSTNTPTNQPTNTPTATPTDTPTNTPTATPTDTPTNTPTDTPTNTPTDTPTNTPTETPTTGPTATVTPLNEPSLVGGGGDGSVTEVAQGITPTLNSQQMTATAFLYSVTQTAAAAQGTNLPPLDTGGSDTSRPTVDTTTGGSADTSGNADTTGDTSSGSTGAVATSYPDCEITIEPDTNLGRIANTYGMDIDTITAANNITNPDFIKAGDPLIIPGCGRNPTPTPTPDGSAVSGSANDADGDGILDGPPEDPDNTNGPVTYTVQAGDNIYGLSQRFGVTMSEIVAANSIPDINVLSVGTQLTIPIRSREVNFADDNATTDTETSTDGTTTTDTTAG